MLELAILGLLEDQPLHGYELKKRLSDVLGGAWTISFGSLYPALRKLERTGAIRAEEPARDSSGSSSIPATGSIGGEAAAARLPSGPRQARRGRKAYRITTDGDRAFQEMLGDPSGLDDDRLFSVKLAFARHLPHEHRVELLRRRRAIVADRLDHVRRSHRSNDRYTHSLAEHRARGVAADLTWLDELLAAELRVPAPVAESDEQPDAHPSPAVARTAHHQPAQEGAPA